jgi:16S rRNA (cytosine1402-N4)-methyltransferase
MKKRIHEPVMTREVIDYLHIKKGGKYIDATLGAGGHTKAILQAGGEVLGIDADREMIEIVRENLEGMPASKFKLIQGNFRDLDKLVSDFKPVDGILFDLGVSNIHFADRTRGFSFEKPEASLDMRLDPDSQAVTAADLLNGLRKEQLEALFGQTMSFGEARGLTQKVLARRNQKSFTEVSDFLEVVGKTRGKLNPATKPFLALRMAVNSELENLEIALPKAFELLATHGRLVVISFHSAEDRIVKNFVVQQKEKNQARVLTKKPIRPREEEVAANPKSRSARLRVLEKI